MRRRTLRAVESGEWVLSTSSNSSANTTNKSILCGRRGDVGRRAVERGALAGECDARTGERDARAG